ncbi:hypothetical protein QSH57_007021 [Fusarium oxysporum f. sp. vasinfectum]|nr:hypothetical protein QSH57_007021 [Fusarium oxysporum f. sp. vasinfectum]
MAGYQAVNNLEVLKQREHRTGHDTSHSTANSIGYSSQDAITNDTGQAGLLDKSCQWNLNINERPLRSQETFVVPPRRQQNRQWCYRIGLPGMIILTFGTGVILFSVALLIVLWQVADKARSRHHRAEFWDKIVL